MSFADFQWGWVHTLPEAEQRCGLRRLRGADAGSSVRAGGVAPFTRTLAVDFAKADRAPLLIVAGASIAPCRRR